MAANIYTKKGDKGKTALIGGVKVSKGNIRIESYGTIDELNAYLGLVKDLMPDEHSKHFLGAVQNTLFTLGALLSCAPGMALQMQLPQLTANDVRALEREVDTMEGTLPAMKNFILPGGHVIVSHIHISRCICRRAERLCVAMTDMQEPVDPLIIKYINRLSDYLFILGRYTGSLLKIEETIWKSPGTKQS